MESIDYSDAEAAEYFVFRYCAVCRSEFVAEDRQVPPYSWVHDITTGEHRRPGGLNGTYPAHRSR